MKADKNEVLFWAVPALILVIISFLFFSLSFELGVSVSITIGGIIFTTIWLYVLLPQRERKKWKVVENEVKKELVGTLRSLCEITIGYFKGSIVTVSFEVREGINEEEIWEKARFEKFKEFTEKEKLKVSEIGKRVLKKGNSRTFSRYKGDLSEIERKYFRFMKPEEILHLIKIQKLLVYLTNIIESTQVRIFETPDKYYEEKFSEYSLELLKELFQFHKNILGLYPKT